MYMYVLNVCITCTYMYMYVEMCVQTAVTEYVGTCTHLGNISLMMAYLQGPNLTEKNFTHLKRGHLSNKVKLKSLNFSECTNMHKPPSLPFSLSLSLAPSLPPSLPPFLSLPPSLPPSLPLSLSLPPSLRFSGTTFCWRPSVSP